MVISGGGTGVADIAGEPGQRVVGTGLHVEGVGRVPTAGQKFCVDVFAVVQVVEGVCAFDSLDTAALVVVNIAAVNSAFILT